MDIRILANQLAKEANSGNEEARALLLKLISQTKSLSKLKKRVDKKQVNKKVSDQFRPSFPGGATP